MAEESNPYEPPSAPLWSPQKSERLSFSHGIDTAISDVSSKVKEALLLSLEIPPEIQELITTLHLNERYRCDTGEIFNTEIRADRIDAQRIRYYIVGKYETTNGKLILKKYDEEVDVDQNGVVIEKTSFRPGILFRRIQQHEKSAPLKLQDPDQFTDRILHTLKQQYPHIDPSTRVTVDPVGIEWTILDSHNKKSVRLNIFGAIIPPIKLRNDLFSRFTFTIWSPTSHKMELLP